MALRDSGDASQGAATALLRGPEREHTDASLVFIAEIVERVASFLSPNDVTCLRLVSKSTASQFSRHTTLRLSQPVPHWAFTAHWSPSACRRLPLARRRRLLRLTATSNHVPNLAFAVFSAGCEPPADVLHAALASGALQSAAWLADQGCPLLGALSAAAGGGRRDACEWCFERGCAWTHEAPCAAAAEGHTQLMEWLLQQPSRPVQALVLLPSLLASAARGCPLQALQALWGGSQHWLLRVEPRRALLPPAAAASPTPDWRQKVEWLESQGCPRTEEAAAEVASLCPDAEAPGRLAWLRARRYPVTPAAVRAAAAAGRARTLRWLLSEAVRPPDTQASGLAAQGGHLAALRELQAARCPMAPFSTALLAASAGSLETLEWLEGVFGAAALDLGERAVEGGLRAGSAEVAAWVAARAGEGEVGLRPGLWAAAAEGGSVEALEWLEGRGCPMPDDGSPYVVACRQGDMATLDALQALGCPLGPAGREGLTLARAVTALQRRPLSPLPPLRWLAAALAAAGRRAEWAAARDAAERHLTDVEARQAVLTWLDEQMDEQAESGGEQGLGPG
ncbi:hypothetical protein HYH03_002833 [Edaphochlamys debaryana]|uniref:Uncharacterized protein n=1 Tax=Edaphochlamys debaryana TaxID=47281 RepID=A0A836C4Y2_9CHLO|nr:hypothetical protein HYH03_002833 [Edaphochlamys debaryana]|eukprot:KAG2499254.1 hypothetical protein HYH03_002833 [Edaphochlamys debaryana]